MTNPNIHLLMRPHWGDAATDYGTLWFGEVKADMERLGIEVIDMYADLAVQPNVNNAITSKSPSYITGIGHGNATLYTGQRQAYIFQVGGNLAPLSGSSMYLQSCETARELGQALINAGVKSYCGYYPDYTFVVDYTLEKDNLARPFCTTNNEYSRIFSHGRNGTAQQAHNAVKGLAQLCIDYAELYGEPDQIQWLLNDYFKLFPYNGVDYEPISLKGNSLDRVENVITHRTSVAVIGDVTGTKGGHVHWKVAVTCPEGCDLRGGSIKVIDVNNILLAEVLVDTYDEQYRVNSTPIFDISVPDVVGEKQFKIIYSGNSLHSPVEEPFTLYINGRATMAGYVRDEITHQTLPNIQVQFWNAASEVRTDANGYYTQQLPAPGHYRCWALTEKYYPEEYVIDTVDGGVYNVDFNMQIRNVIKVPFESSPPGISFWWKDPYYAAVSPKTFTEYGGRDISFYINFPQTWGNFTFSHYEYIRPGGPGNPPNSNNPGPVYTTSHNTNVILDDVDMTPITAVYTEGPPSSTYVLTVQPCSGSGSVLPTVGPHTFNVNTIVQCVATPSAGSEFVNWIIDGVNDTAQNPMYVLMTANHTIQAVFKTPPPIIRTLTVFPPNGQGTTIPPTGNSNYNDGTQVRVSASPASGWKFDHWIFDGNNNDINPLMITMNKDHTVLATFTQLPPPTPSLTLSCNRGALSFILDGISKTMPFSEIMNTGTHIIIVPQIATIDGKKYQFQRWSDGSKLLSRVITLNTSVLLSVQYKPMK